MMTDIFYAIGDFFQWSFQYIEKLGNTPNFFFIGLISVIMLVWIRFMFKYNKEAETNGTLK